MNKVPMEDLPDNLVSKDDLPDNLVPQDDLPDELAQSVYADNGVIAGGVQENAFVDSAKGLGAGLTSGARAMQKLISTVADPIANAITYPLVQGVNKLKGQEIQSFGDYSNQQTDLMNKMREASIPADYQPQTAWGKTSKFVGELAPYLFAPAGTLMKDGITGAVQGGINSINNDKNPITGALGGAATSMVTHGLIKGGGKAFEKIQPNIAEFTAGIPKESYQRALDSLKGGQNFFAGKFDKVKSYYPVTQKIKEQMSEQFKPQEYFTGKFKELGQSAENFANKYFTPDNVINEGYRKVAEKVKGGGEYLNTVLGGMVGKQTKLLAKDEPVPVMSLFNIIGSSIRNAGRGSAHNPSGLAAEPIAEAMQRRILNTALKPHGITADDIFNTIDETGLPFNKVLDGYGINPSDLVIDRVGLHNEKEFWQHQINHNADWKPHKGIIDRWQRGFNKILRENKSYAKANDEYANFKNILDEHSWLNSPDQIASRLANSEGKAGILFDTKEKLQQLDDLLPNLYKFKNDLEHLVSKQQAQNALKSNLSSSVYNNMGNYNKAPLDVQYAFEQLNAKSPNKFLDELNLLTQQQAKEQAEQKLLTQGLINNPRKILENKSEDAYNAFSRLNDNAGHETKQFMNQLEDLNARQYFEQIAPHYGSDVRVPLGHGALGLYAGSSALHGNFAPMLLGLNASPAIQKMMLQMYIKGAKSKAIKYVPRVITTGANQFNQK